MRFPMNAYEQGQMARHDNRPRKNPYSMFSAMKSHELWHKGYDKGGWRAA